MEYRGIRYTVRAGIAWFVSIYPNGNEVVAKRTFDNRSHAEFHAQDMIKRWLEPSSAMRQWESGESGGQNTTVNAINGIPFPGESKKRLALVNQKPRLGTGLGRAT